MAVFTVCDMLFGRKRRERIGQYVSQELRSRRLRAIKAGKRLNREGEKERRRFLEARSRAFFSKAKKLKKTVMT